MSLLSFRMWDSRLYTVAENMDIIFVAKNKFLYAISKEK